MERDCEYCTGFYEINNIFKEDGKVKVDMHEIGKDHANR